MAAQPEPAHAAALGPDLDAATRAALGLPSGARARVRERGTRILLVERGAAGGPAIPEDRPVALCADVRTFPIADVLGWLHAAGRSGLVHFSREAHAQWIWMHHGEVVFAASNERIDRLGHSLVRAGALSLEQLRDAERAFRSGERFGKTLVERGLLTPRALWAGLERQVEEIVRSLFCHAAGVVYYWDGAAQPDNVVRLALPTKRLIHEGLRWAEELRGFEAALCDPRARVEVVPEQRESLPGTERALFDALAGEGSFPALCRQLGLDRQATARTLQLLHAAGAVRLRCSDEDPDRTQRVRRSDRGERVRAHVHDAVKLLGELAAAIAAADGGGGIDERFAGVVEAVAGRFPGLLAGVRPGRGGVLDAEVLIERALALPAERLGDVREALTALADYLEFEVKNHAAIADAEAVLRPFEALRARVRT